VAAVQKQPDDSTGQQSGGKGNDSDEHAG
jgi:hypothetical protein